MDFPFFYIDNVDVIPSSFALNEQNSKHIAQVLRMQNGEQLQLTDGKGNLFMVEIMDSHKKKCIVKLISTAFIESPSKKVTIAISLVKNSSRFEWFLEKATEIGVNEVIPLICQRTEKQHFRYDRMKNIIVSAMLQSKQCRIPILHEPTKYTNYINYANAEQKFIAHCQEDTPKQLLTDKLINGLTNQPINQLTNKVMLIGPEGDFTREEIELALKNGFTPVALGNTRLRTETAGVVAASILCQL